MTNQNEVENNKIDSTESDTPQNTPKAGVEEATPLAEKQDGAEQTKPEGIKEEEKKKSFWKDMIQTIVLAVLIFLVLNTLTSRVKVFNVSMQPTLKQGNLLVVSKMAYKWGKPKRGDIIVFHHAGIEDQDYIKRVIGLPGDHIEIKAGVVSVNGTPLTEPYIKEMPRYTLSENVPEDKLFVLGDNRNQSDDSHSWGFVDMNWVVGKALIIYWPLNEIRILTGPDVMENSSKSGLGSENAPQSFFLCESGLM